MIELRSFQEDDFETLISWVDNEEFLIRFAGPVFTYPLTKEQLATYISDEKRLAFKVVKSDTAETIGHAEIYLSEEGTARLCRILIGKEEHRGKGMGGQIIQRLTDHSFGKLNAAVAELNVFDGNIAAIKCYEKAGFKVNPDKRTTMEVNGSIWTAINMRIRKTEYTE